MGAPIPAAGAAIAEAEKNFGVVKELRDGARRTGVQLALEVVEIELRRLRLGMYLGIGGDRDIEIRNRFEARHQIRGVSETVAAGLIAHDPLRRVAAQSHYVPYAFVPVLARDVEDLTAAGADTGEMRCSGQRSLPLDACYELVRARARRAISTIRNGDESRRQRRQALHGAPQRRFHLRIAGREELE